MNKKEKYILWFKDVSSKDVALVGGKNASLGEMQKTLVKKGINIPNGFTLSSKAYWYFIDKNNLRKKIEDILKGLDTADIKNLQTRGKKIRGLILSAQFPQD